MSPKSAARRELEYTEARLIAPDCADDGAAQILEKALRGEIG